MRLSAEQVKMIVYIIQKHISSQSRIWLFGSRVDDNKRGGDIDLYVEIPAVPDLFNKKIDAKLAFEDHFGEQKIDLLIHDRSLPETAIHIIAKDEGIRLNS